MTEYSEIENIVKSGINAIGLNNVAAHVEVKFRQNSTSGNKKVYTRNGF